MAAAWQPRLKQALEDCLGFWLRHSLDTEHGGYYNCLDRDGSVYDTDKHVWLQGRQVFTLSRLYMERESLRTDTHFEAIRLGAEFLRSHAHAPGNRIYFCLSETGQPVKLQRKIFAECFFVMAMSEYARVLKLRGQPGADTVFAEACDQFQHICRFADDLTLVGQTPMTGAIATHALNMPMIMLNVICELRAYSEDATFEKDRAATCLEQIKMHVHADRRAVLETVAADGSFLDTPAGRLLNPGHAIEAGWFILDYARRYGSEEEKEALVPMALSMIEWSYDAGWDDEFGGIYYFLDCNGHSPEQLEWSMKLWWVHNEAMVACAMAYDVTRDPAWWKRFEQVAEYTMTHFPDTAQNSIQVLVPPPARTGVTAPPASMQQPGGGWFGYLTREGHVSQRFKGGPYKGFFHVPRCLHLCLKLMEELNPPM